MADEGLYEFSVRKHGTEKLKTFLVAVEESERWELVGALASDVLVVLGVGLWALAAWPGLVGGEAREICLGLWGVLLAVRVVALVAARVWRRRCARYRSIEGAEEVQ